MRIDRGIGYFLTRSLDYTARRGQDNRSTSLKHNWKEPQTTVAWNFENCVSPRHDSGLPTTIADDKFFLKKNICEDKAILIN